MRESIEQTYRQLMLTYELSDKIYLFGWSRGAFAAVRFCDLLLAKGIQPMQRISEVPRLVNDVLHSDMWARSMADLSNQEDIAQAVNAIENPAGLMRRPLAISYLGLFDCVPAIGLPLGMNKFFRMNDHMSRDAPDINKVGIRLGDYENMARRLPVGVRAFRHAVALDEESLLFKPYTMTDLRSLKDRMRANAQEYGREDRSKHFRQSYFPGGHGAVGGALSFGGIGDCTRHWVARGAEEQGLEFDWHALGLHPVSRMKHASRITIKEAKQRSGFPFNLPGTLRRRAIDPINVDIEPEVRALMARDISYAASVKSASVQNAKDIPDF